MGRSISQNYRCALDGHDKLIRIEDAIKRGSYYCPSCRAEMIVRQGKKREWHYAHKSNVNNCSYESYLHKIAKSEIREAFNNSEKFMISYDVPISCEEKDTCPIQNGKYCKDRVRKEFDVKEYYDYCEEEAPYKNFRADLMLRSSDKPDRKPILIEIYVSHESTVEKKSDGVRIIEIKINSEDDIDKIVNELRIEGDTYSDRYYPRDEKPKNIFYNFKGSIEKPPSYFNSMMCNRVYYFCLDRKSYCKGGWCRCYEDIMEYVPKNVHYIISHERIDWKQALFEFVKNDVNVRNCLICKYYKSQFDNVAICCLYKKFNTPQNPKLNTAINCQHFMIGKVAKYGVKLHYK